MTRFCKTLLFMILGTSSWGAMAQNGRLSESEMPASCRREAIRTSLTAERLELTEDNILLKQDVCLMTHSAASSRQARSFPITLNSVPNTCTDTAVDTIFEGRNKSSDPLLKGKIQLRLAICTYARAGARLRNLDGLTTNDLKTLNSALGYVREAGIKGIDSQSQAFAFFFEGILEASRAEILYRAFAARPRDNNISERTEFCQSRRMALASLASVDWGAFDYEFNTSFSSVTGQTAPSTPEKFAELTGDLPTIMANSFGGTRALSSVQASTCGEFNPLSAGDKEVIADKAVNSVMADYFGATGPVTAMLANKQARVELPKEAFRKKLTDLETRGKGQEAKHTMIKSNFDSRFKEPLGKLLNSYEDAYATIYTIDDWARRWQAGLMLSPQGTNTAIELRNAMDTLKGNVNDVTLGEFQAKLDGFQASLAAALDRPKQFARNTKMLCRINFCEIRGNYVAKRTSTCTSIDFEKSPICKDTERFKLTNESGKNVQDICREAGLEDKYMQATLANTDRDECLKQLAVEVAAP